MLSRVGGSCQGIGAVVLAAALLLAGCSGSQEPDGGSTAGEGPVGGDTGAAGPAPTTSETPGTEEPSEAVPELSPNPKPERPSAMDDTGEKGAIAAAEYFFELYNYVQSTGETDRIVQSFATTCTACINLTERINAIYEADGYMVGGEVNVDGIEAQPTVDGLAWEVSYDMAVDAMTVVNEDGTTEQYPATRYDNARLGAQLIDGSWQILELYSSRS